MDSADWDQRYAGRELVWTSDANRFLVIEAESLTPARALDLACGEGRNAVWLAERGWQVTGVDFSSVAIQKAKQLENARGVRADWMVADLLEYRPETLAFELVIVFYLQAPGEQRTPILRAAAEAVARGGVFLLVGHDSSNIEQGYGGPQDPAVLYTAEDVAGRPKRCRSLRAGVRLSRAPPPRPSRAGAGGRPDPTQQEHSMSTLERT